MRGKRPKERKSYVLRMEDGSLVQVTREVYLEWYQSKRREKYQSERKRKYGVCSLDALGGVRGFPEAGGCAADGPEEDVIKKICIEKLREGLSGLSKQDAFLIRLLFFEGMTAKDAAQICGCSRKTVYNRKKRILRELYEAMGELGIVGGCF